MKYARISLGLAGLLVVATLIAACAAATPALTGTWKLVAVGDLPSVEGGEITFADDGQASFRTGCNSGGGSYTVEATNLAFDALMMTEMACDEPRNSQERAFIKVLDADPPFVIAGNQLTLGSGAETLTFERA